MAVVTNLLLFLICNAALRAENAEKDGGASVDNHIPYLSAFKANKNRDGASKALFYDFFPNNLNEQKPSFLEIRSIFSGSVQVVKSVQFGISVNISGANTYELASIEADYIAINDTILLQLKGGAPVAEEGLTPLITLAIVVGASLAIMIIVTCAYLCFWMMKFDGKKEHHKLAAASSTPSLDGTFDSLSLQQLDTNSLIKSWRDYRLTEDEDLQPAEDQLTKIDEASLKHPGMGNGDINRSSHMTPTRVDSSSENNASRPSSHRRPRYRASTQRSRDISSSDDLSSIDDNWSRRKAPWRTGNAAARRAQFSERVSASGDGGFSSGQEYRSPKSHGPKSHVHDADDLEWDEYEMMEGTLPPPSEVLNGLQLSTDDEKHQESTWPPPFSDDSEKDTNLNDVRAAIHNAMDSVNRDAKGFYHIAAGDINANRDMPTNKAGSPPHDDGYETGVAVNGLASPEAKVSNAPSTAPKPTRTSGSGGSRPGPSRLSTTVLMSVTILGLVAGAYGVTAKTTQANVIVFVPDNFFEAINVFINEPGKVDFDVSRKPKDTKVQLFELSNPIITSFEEDKCQDRTDCEHGCNRKTGICVCSQGYVLYDDTKCTDRSDCLYLPCKPTEHCSNTIGGYTCTCVDDYWRDSSGTCVVCAETQCPPGTYESSECPNRVCLPCSDGCPDGQYKTAVCSPTANIQCAECAPPCLEDQYEYRPCSKETDRACRNASELPMAVSSGNLILESVSGRKSPWSSQRYMNTARVGQQFSIQLARSIDIDIEVSVKSINLYPILRPVVHEDSNDNDEFPTNGGNLTILLKSCPFPMPESYELFPVMHSNVTAAKHSNCPDCPIDPREACKTYTTFGRTAPLEPHNKSLVCTEPGILPKLFNLNSYLAKAGSIAVQPTAECEALKSSCDSCSMDCAREIVAARDTNCSITEADKSNSWSPRLSYCQNCCLNKNCRDRCSATQHCNPTSCWRGNVVEFLLSAKFPQGPMEYYCNVELPSSVRLIALEYTVLYKKTIPLKNFSVTIFQNESTIKQDSYSDGLLTINYETGLQTVPDLIHGEMDLKKRHDVFTAGRYTAEGTAAVSGNMSRRALIPAAPFAMNTQWWKMQNCSEMLMDNFLASNSQPIMDPHPEINVSRMDTYTYSLWNKSAQPWVSFSVPSEVSVIQKLYPSTTVDKSSLKAFVNRFNAGWRLVVDGRTTTCPGYFKVKVWEAYKKTPLAEYEAAIRGKEERNCGKFSITFTITGSAVERIDRRMFRVEIIDAEDKRYILQAESEPYKTEKRNPAKASRTSGEPKENGKSAMLIIGPFLLFIGVTILIMSIAWIVSVVIPKDHGPVKSSPHCRAALLLFYSLLRVVYILVTSLSIFAFIWYAINIEDLVVVQNYMNAVDTVISEQQTDLRGLIDFSTQTVVRQQQQFKHMREQCFNNIQRHQNYSQQSMQELGEEIYNELSSLPERNELTNSLEERARELSDMLETYRQNYNSLVQIASEKLTREIEKTTGDFEKTSWLAAARTIRNAVRSIDPDRLPEPVLGFQKWMGIRTPVGDVHTNFLMDALPMSEIKNLQLPQAPPVPDYHTIDLENVFMPTHHLYSQKKAPQISKADAAKRPFGVTLTPRLPLFSVLLVLLILDFLMLTSRIAETLDTGQQILDGYVIQKTYNQTYQDGCSSQKYIRNKLIKNPQRVRYRLYKLILETRCVPLSIALAIVVGISFSCLVVSLNFVTFETLTEVGLFSSLIGPWNLTSTIALDNIQMNIERINRNDIPATEATMNNYIERIEILNNVFNNLSYYKWQLECGDSPSQRCGEFNYSKLVPPLDVKDINCTLHPIRPMGPADMPRTLTDDRAKYLVRPYIDAFTSVLESSASLLLTYASYILIVKMSSAVLWNFLTRTAYVPGVRILITNQLAKPEEPPTSEDSEVPTHIKFNRSTIEEDSLEDRSLLEESDDKLTDNRVPNGGTTVSLS